MNDGNLDELIEYARKLREQRGEVICDACGNEELREACQHDSGYLCPSCSYGLEEFGGGDGLTVREQIDLLILLYATVAHFRKVTLAKRNGSHTAKLAGVV